MYFKHIRSLITFLRALMVIVVLSSVHRVYPLKAKEILKINDFENILSPSLVATLTNGLQLAASHCKVSFQWNRWNCPHTAFMRKDNEFTKEAAYVKAILSAGIVYSVTKACSRGEIESCGCNTKLVSNVEPFTSDIEMVAAFRGQKPNGPADWWWGGCSDDTSYGQKIATKYLDPLVKGDAVNTLVGLHNNKVGRQIVGDTMVKKCRCHGISSSCSIQTCWMQVAPFPTISEQLKNRYRKAVVVSYSSVGHGNLIRGDNNKESSIAVKSNALLYIGQSPNYCQPDVNAGWPGTKGRICSKRGHNESEVSLDEKRSCRNLCRSCDYRVRKRRRSVTLNCNCEFVWCCNVKCTKCSRVVDEYFCG